MLGAWNFVLACMLEGFKLLHCLFINIIFDESNMVEGT